MYYEIQNVSKNINPEIISKYFNPKYFFRFRYSEIHSKFTFLHYIIQKIKILYQDLKIIMNFTIQKSRMYLWIQKYIINYMQIQNACPTQNIFKISLLSKFRMHVQIKKYIQNCKSEIYSKFHNKI